ncbi:MAG: DsbC family protein [Gammaproteobacteria bacterium]|nr:DsbC family protein [Gammaproteobacteria bacterium]
MKNGLWVLVFLGVCATAQAADTAEQQKATKALATILPGMTPDSVAPSKLPGIYEAVFGTQVIYVSKDGKFLFQGDIIDVAAQKNITEATRSKQRLKLLNAMDESEMIVFAPKKTKYTVTIFTDVDCGYCRKLHNEIDQYLDRGIRIRYLAFPRSGENTESYYKAVTVWCSDDKQKALTRSKTGEELPKNVCANNPVRKHMQWASDFNVNGTPTLILENGDVIPGYVPAPKLEKILAQAK